MILWFHFGLLEWSLALLFVSTLVGKNPPNVSALVTSNLVEKTGGWIGGVSALARVRPQSSGNADDGFLVAVGTKRGGLHFLRLANDGSSISTRKIDTYATEDKRPRMYPVYSIDCDGTTIFCGGGDRYISVWKLKESLKVSSETVEEPGWNLSKQLGPHTGWVKATVLDDSSASLFSIGCNCIETWKLTKEKNWVHCMKSTIASDPKAGTLSSDLLCLCELKGQQKLASGGVDGRIHIWDMNAMDSPNFERAAHEGRVNALCYEDITGHLFSVGHDGYLKCWCSEMGKLELRSALNLGVETRATAVACYRDERKAGNLNVVVGTSNGNAILVVAATLENAGSNISLSFEQQHELEGNPVVNAVLPLRRSEKNGTTIILLGHSDGLGYVKYDTKRDPSPW